MKNNTFKEILLPAIMLFIIALVCTALLAGTNMVTADKIAELEVKASMEAKIAVFPDAASFSDENTIDYNGSKIPYYEALDSEGNVIGYVFATTTKSYGGDISCMVGISCKDNKITGVELTTINDTPGLGMKAKGEDFLSQYIGRGENIGVNKNENTDTEIKAISGATITSKAVTTAVNDAFGAYELIKAGESNG